MRKFMNIVEQMVVVPQTGSPAYYDDNKFGSGSLSRATDPDEEIEFSVFSMEKDIEAVKALLAEKFPNVKYEVVSPLATFAKYTFKCKGARKDAEGVSRAVKMARLNGAATRID